MRTMRQCKYDGAFFDENFFLGLEDTLLTFIIFTVLQWTPPNVCVPILNLVDNIFQLKKRGWLRYITLFGLSVFSSQ